MMALCVCLISSKTRRVLEVLGDSCTSRFDIFKALEGFSHSLIAESNDLYLAPMCNTEGGGIQAFALKLEL